MDLKSLLTEHAGKYPEMQAQDYVKLVYQHALGCGHLVKDAAECLRRIRLERENGEQTVFPEPIGNGLVRLHFKKGNTILSDEAVCAMFMETANAFTPEKDALETALKVLEEVSKEEALSVPHSEISAYLAAYRAQGMPLVSHTEAYRNAYAPAYRVVSERFCRLFPIIEAAEQIKKQKGRALIAIDGMCASGKTTLSGDLARCLNASVFHMDDFFLPPAKRTPERLNEPGGNVDYERFLTEVLEPLKTGLPFRFRPFDCSTMSLSEPVDACAGEITLVEGAYACHPTLIDHYDYIVVMTIGEELQKARILKRNGEFMLKRFVNEWIPMELKYLSHFSIEEKADFIIKA